MQQPVALFEISPKEWRSNKHTHVLVYLFPTAVLPNNTSLVYSIEKLALQVIRHPVFCCHTTLSEPNSFYSYDAGISYQSGQKYISIKPKVSDLAPGDYLFVSSPFHESVSERSEMLARSAILQLRGLLTIVLGHAVAETEAVSFTHGYAKSNTTHHSGPIENFILPEDHNYIEDPNGLEKLVEKLSEHLPEELRRKCLTAFNFIGQSSGVIDPTTRFVNLWIAVEIVCGSRAIARQQVQAFDCRDLLIRFDALKAARDNLMHKGREFNISAEDERLLKAIIFRQVAGYYRMEDIVSAPAGVFFERDSG